VPGDYDGDRKTDYALFRPSTGDWWVAYNGGNRLRLAAYFGFPTDIPVPADYNGDGKTDIAVFQPGLNSWAISYTGGLVGWQGNWGSHGDIPLAAPPKVRHDMAIAAAPIRTYTITAQHSSHCLDVVDASTANGARVQQWQCNGSAQQKWDLVPTQYGTFHLKNRVSGKCLDVVDAHQTDGTALQQWNCNGAAQQQFTVPASGVAGTIRVYGKCLDITGGSNTMGARLQLWTCLGNLNQNFKLTQTS
jgi:hypothetical protein